MEFTHTNEKGDARMVDVGGKNDTRRTAKAQAFVYMQPETLRMIREDGIRKGDVLATARIAGIMAGKKASELIPLCHALPIESLTVDFILNETERRVEITANASCAYKTGIEMEAITVASMAAVTVYDMCKAVDRGMVISDIMLLEKTGGKHDYRREEE